MAKNILRFRVYHHVCRYHQPVEATELITAILLIVIIIVIIIAIIVIIVVIILLLIRIFPQRAKAEA